MINVEQQSHPNHTHQTGKSVLHPSILHPIVPLAELAGPLGGKRLNMLRGMHPLGPGQAIASQDSNYQVGTVLFWVVASALLCSMHAIWRHY